MADARVASDASGSHKANGSRTHPGDVSTPVQPEAKSRRTESPLQEMDGMPNPIRQPSFEDIPPPPSPTTLNTNERIEGMLSDLIDKMNKMVVKDDLTTMATTMVKAIDKVESKVDSVDARITSRIDGFENRLQKLESRGSGYGSSGRRWPRQTMVTTRQDQMQAWHRISPR